MLEIPIEEGHVISDLESVLDVFAILSTSDMLMQMMMLIELLSVQCNFMGPPFACSLLVTKLSPSHT